MRVLVVRNWCFLKPFAFSSVVLKRRGAGGGPRERVNKKDCPILPPPHFIHPSMSTAKCRPLGHLILIAGTFSDERARLKIDSFSQLASRPRIARE